MADAAAGLDSMIVSLLRFVRREFRPWINNALRWLPVDLRFLQRGPYTRLVDASERGCRPSTISTNMLPAPEGGVEVDLNRIFLDLKAERNCWRVCARPK